VRVAFTAASAGDCVVDIVGHTIEERWNLYGELVAGSKIPK
jgi:hypothetical protein